MVICELQGPDTNAEAQCLRPDIVVVNSGMHDVFGGDAVLPAFEKEVKLLATKLRAWQDSSLPQTRAFWLSSKSFRSVNGRFRLEVMGLDSLARKRSHFLFRKTLFNPNVDAPRIDDAIASNTNPIQYS